MRYFQHVECAPAKRRSWFSRAALGAIAATFLVAPGASMAAPPRDKVTGHGTLVGIDDDPRLQVNAVNTPNGAKGHFEIEYTDGSFVSGTIVCLLVEGDRADVIGLITEASGPREGTVFDEGQFIEISVLDGGQPDGEDQVNFSEGRDVSAGCENTSTEPTIPIVDGNFRVFDGA